MRLISLLFFILILPETFRSDPLDAVWMVDAGKISFNSNAPLEVISARSNQLKGAIDLEKRTFSFLVKMKSFEGFNADLQKEHFQENYIEVSKYPNASFSGKIVEEINVENFKIMEIRAKGILNIHGVEQERIIKSTLEKSGDNFFVRSKFSVMLQDHNIKIPKIVHEKIASEIFVEIEAKLSKRNAGK